jgi:hypothetical protein
MTTEFNLSEKIVFGDFGSDTDIIHTYHIQEFIKRQIEYQDLKIKLTKDNVYLNKKEKDLIISTCIDTKMKLKADAGDKLI